MEKEGCERVSNRKHTEDYRRMKRDKVNDEQYKSTRIAGKWREA